MPTRAAVLVTDDGRTTLAGGPRVTHDPTFWLLARASGLTAYVLLTLSVLAGLVVKSRPFGRAVKAASVTDVHRFLSLLGLGDARAARRHARARLDRARSRSPRCSCPASSAYRPLAVALGVVAAELDWRSIAARSRCDAGSAAATGGASTGRRTSSSSSARVTACAAGTDSAQPWAFGLYLGAVGTVVFATAWRVLTAPSARPFRPKGAHDVPHRRSTVPSAAASATAPSLAPDVFELGASGKASRSHRHERRPSVLDAAAACPMGAIRVVEEEAA